MPALPPPAAVLFVDDVPTMAEFYRRLADMRVEHADADHVVLALDGMQLVIHGLPAWARAPATGAPRNVAAREDSYHKLCFPVPSIAEARQRAQAMGGVIHPAQRQWEARGFRACDGHDPEGNVLQIREPA